MGVVELSEAEMHKPAAQGAAKGDNGTPTGGTSASTPQISAVGDPSSTALSITHGPAPATGDGSSSPSSLIEQGREKSDEVHSTEKRELLALLSELQAAGALDSAAQQELLSDLKQTDPALWPQLIRQFRLAMSYRQRTADPPATATNADGDPLAAAVQKSLQRSPPSPIAKSESNESNRKSTPATSTAQIQTNEADHSVQPATTVDVVSSSPRTTPVPNSASRAPLHPSVHSVSSVANTVASPTKPADPDGWQTRLTELILALESPASQTQSGPAEIDRQIRLRMLYLIAGRRDDALRPIAGLPADQQDFWTKELYGLATYLDAQRPADPEKRATEAALHLQQAAGQLGQLASPVVRNLAFCKEVTSFGVFKRFASNEFKPGEEVLLYCEVENLKSQSTEQGYHTAIKSSYLIFDARGQRIAEQDFPASDDFCANPRRDFFIPYFIALPKRLSSGSYTLQLTIEDSQTSKVGQSSIEFSVK